MPYELHFDLRQPENLNARIWRFMDLPKFLDLLHCGKLHFTRADCFEDPYEGLLTDGYVDVIKAGRTNLDSVYQANVTLMESRTNYYVTSWHMAEHEPAGMWKLYAGTDAGIAIYSTYSRLQHAFDDDKVNRFYLGLVQYDETPLLGRFNTFKFIMNKRPSFQHESEIRGLVWVTPQVPVPPSDRPQGLKLEVNLHSLVCGALVSPTAPPWLPEILRDIVKKYRYSFEIKASELYVNKYLPPASV
jgi:hypothetical protein